MKLTNALVCCALLTFGCGKITLNHEGHVDSTVEVTVSYNDAQLRYYFGVSCRAKCPACSQPQVDQCVDQSIGDFLSAIASMKK